MNAPVNVRPMPTEPPTDADFETKLAWLLMTHGYCELLDRVMMLYEPSDRCLITRPAFTFSRKPWHQIIIGPNGGQTVEYVAATWATRKERIKIRDYRMRPDRDFPTYTEGGETFKNTYRRPVHEGTGDVQTFIDFMKHLLPVEFEREWFLDWLAHKWRNPAIPGVAVVMVASEVEGQIFGTGRGMLRDVLQRLLGKAYARPVDFDIMTGKSSQGVFTDWLAGSILIMVDEAKDTADASRWSERRAVYERLKAIIDPKAVERAFTLKYGQMFYGLCFAGFLIATNNLDAIQIPDGDRRFAVLANGGRMTAEMAKKLQTWMEQEGNIAALAQWLETSDLEKFDPFDASETLTKKAMQEMSRTDRDEAFLTVRKLFGRAALFTGEQFHRAMVAEVPAKTAMREDFGAWASHRLRQTTTSRDGEFRMPLRKSDNKRVLILRWRDYEGPAVKTAEDAQAKVAIIEKILAANTTEERAALLRGLRVIHSEAGDAAE